MWARFIVAFHRPTRARVSSGAYNCCCVECTHQVDCQWKINGPWMLSIMEQNLSRNEWNGYLNNNIKSVTANRPLEPHTTHHDYHGDNNDWPHANRKRDTKYQRAEDPPGTRMRANTLGCVRVCVCVCRAHKLIASIIMYVCNFEQVMLIVQFRGAAIHCVRVCNRLHRQHTDTEHDGSEWERPQTENICLNLAAAHLFNLFIFVRPTAQCYWLPFGLKQHDVIFHHKKAKQEKRKTISITVNTYIYMRICM